MKKQFQKGVLAVGILGLVAGMSGNVVAAEAIGETKATVIKSIRINPGQAFSFGRFARTNEGGSVGVDRVTCDLTSATNVPHFGQQTCGTFDVYGAAGEEFDITYPDGGQIKTGAGGPNETMDYTLILNDDGDDSKTLNSDGEASLQFGGNLVVKTGQEPGVYTGNYVVSVDYLNVTNN